MISLLMADDHLLVRNGLKHILQCFDDVAITAEAGNGDEVLAALQKDKFDLVLLDVSMPGLSGVELILRLREQMGPPPILVLSMYNELQVVKRMLKAGASGYMTKDASPEELIDGIRRVAGGGRYLARDLAEKIAFEASAASPFVAHEVLTGRELIILRMLAKGIKIREIAKELGISNKTVSAHKAHIMQKMHIASDAKLMQYAVTHGFTYP